MNFITGVLDSDDLQMNINREQLQEYKQMKIISKKIVRSALDMITKLSKNITRDS